LLESLQLWLSLPDLLLHFLCTCALFLPNGIVENRVLSFCSCHGPERDVFHCSLLCHWLH
jgi:hypothetical protein